MAWKVYGFMEGHTTGRTTVYGPLPRKRWIASKGDKKRRIAVTNAFKAARFDRDEQARKGIEYALWLARRDVKELPGGSACVVWANVALPTGKFQSRVRAVSFGNSPSTRVTIEIPSWDFIPAAPVLEINDDYFHDLLAA